MALLKGFKRLKLLGLGCLLLSGWTNATPPAKKELQLAKDYVLAACIGAQYGGTALDNETDAWAAMLVDAGSLPADAYLKLDKLAKSAPPAIVSQHGVVLRLKRCVDFINTPETVAKIGKLLVR